MPDDLSFTADPHPSSDLSFQTDQQQPQQHPSQTYGNWLSSAVNYQPTTPKTGNPLVDTVNAAGDTMATAPMTLAQGLAKGVLNTGIGGAKLIGHMLGLKEDDPEYAKQLTEAHGIGQNLGKFLEQAAEYYVTGGGASALGKKLGPGALAKLGSLGLESAASGATGAVQSGGDTRATIAAAAAPVVGGAVSGGLGLAKGIADKVMSGRPLSQDAADLAAQNSIPVTSGNASGSKVVQHIEKILGHTVAPDVMAQTEAAQQKGLNSVASNLAGGMSMTPHEAGTKILSRLNESIPELDTAADQNYQKFRDISAQNSKPVVTGQTVSPIVDANGNPIVTPKTTDVSFPVSMTGVKSQLRPLYNKLNQLNEVVRQSDPGYRALSDIMSAPDTVSAETADRALGTLKSISRDAQMPELRNQAQGVAANAIKTLQPAVDSAIGSASPEARQALIAGRKAVADKYATADLIKGLGAKAGDNGDTVTLFRSLVNGNNLPELQKVISTVPDAKAHIGNAFLQDIFSKPTEEGGFGAVAGAADKWRKLDPEVKKTLYGPQQSQDISVFMTLAKRLAENPNSSNTGAANVLARMLHNPLTMVAGTAGAIMHPGAAVAGMGGIYGARKLAAMLYNPDGASALRKLMAFGPGSATGQAAQAALDKLFESVGSSGN